MSVKKYTKYKLKRLRYLAYCIANLPVLQVCLGYLSICILSYRFALLALVSVAAFGLLGRKWLYLVVGGILALVRVNQALPPGIYDQLASATQGQVTLVGEVVNEPELKDFSQVLLFKENEIFGNLRLELPKYPLYQRGDVLRLKAQLEFPENFNDFDYVSYLLSKGVLLSGRAEAVEKLDQSANLDTLGSKAKQGLVNSISSHVHEPRAGLLAGILLGEKADLAEDVKVNLQSTGLTHVISVSGYNFSIIFGVLLLMAGKLPRSTIMGISTIAMIGLLYVVGTDNLPAVRAVTMLLIGLLGYLLGRNLPLILNLIYCCTIMLFVYPFTWLSMSFQLSVFALLGLVLFSKALQNAIKLPNWFENMMSTLSVLLISTPLTFAAFGTASIIAPLTNLLLLPLVPVMMLFGALGIATSLVQGLSSFCFWLADLCAALFLRVVEISAKVPIATSSNTILVGSLFIGLCLLWLRGDYLYVKSLFHEQG